MMMNCPFKVQKARRSAKPYLNLPVPSDKCQVTYIWIDGTGSNLRAKSRILDFLPKDPKDLPEWDLNGAATMQAEESNSDIYLFPVAMYNDPFHGSNCSKLALCETYKYNKKPTQTNRRTKSSKLMKQFAEEQLLFGIEEKVTSNFTRLQTQASSCLVSSLSPQYQMLSSANKPAAKLISELHFRGCLHAGINILEMDNGPVEGEWTYFIGTSDGLTFGDDVWTARYILHRISEDLQLVASINSCSEEQQRNEDKFMKIFFSCRELCDSNSRASFVERARKNIIKCQQKESDLDIFSGIQVSQDILDKFIPVPEMQEIIGGEGTNCPFLNIPWRFVTYYDGDKFLNNSDPYEVSEKIVKAIYGTE